MDGVSEWIPSKPDASVGHLPAADFQLPLLSAPSMAGEIPVPHGYLSAPEESVTRWKHKLGAKKRPLRAGICWAGNPNHKNDHNRSIPPELLSELNAVSGVEWINLQKGHPEPESLPMLGCGTELGDFADTAGLVENIDLVISVDTSIAHLAGALGKPVWVLLPFAPDWRWQLERSDSPWYSGARLFRQPAPGEWRPVMKQIAREVTRLASRAILEH